MRRHDRLRGAATKSAIESGALYRSPGAFLGIATGSPFGGVLGIACPLWPWCHSGGRTTPMYGPAVRRKRFSSICRLFGLASMYPASDWSVCSGPPWISARMRSHYRPGLKWAIWVTSVRMRREDRPPSRLILSQTSAGNGICYFITCSLSVQFLCSCQEAVPSSRPAVDLRAPRAGAVKPGRRVDLTSGSAFPGQA